MTSDTLSLLSSSKLNDVLATGEWLLSEHFEGVAYGWRDGDVSLRQLASDLDVSLTSLYRCVAVTSMWMECGQPELHHLGVSHLRELVSLKPGVQHSILELAEEEGWTVAEVRAARKRHSRLGSIRPGRTEGLEPLPLVMLIERWAVESASIGKNMQDTMKLASGERGRLRKKVESLQLELEMLKYRLQDR